MASQTVRRIPKSDPPSPDWRRAKIADREAEALAIDAALAPLAEVEELFEGTGENCHTVRAAAAFLRETRNARLDEAANLRAALTDATKSAAKGAK